MSRSRKKVPIVKDRNPFYKKLSNKLIRKYNKVILRLNPEEILVPNKNEFVNQYDVCDYKFFCFGDKSALRK